MDTDHLHLRVSDAKSRPTSNIAHLSVFIRVHLWFEYYWKPRPQGALDPMALHPFTVTGSAPC